MARSEERPVLLFDGVCNLCNHAVQYVIKHDSRKRFLFASLQSHSGREIITAYTALGNTMPDSMVLFYKGKYYTRSGAALRSAWLTGGFTAMLAVGLIVPPFIRNIVYDWVAAHRYQWFGRKDECMVPTPGLTNRFLP
jgi:predicted DCC family thiol-disulfide oxidoreductase YuxK